MSTMTTATYQCITFLFLLFLCIVSPIESYYREQPASRSTSLSTNNGTISSGVVGSGGGAAISPLTSKINSRKHQLYPIPISSASVKNLCSKDRDMKLVCHCSPEDYINIKATKADCWIFHDDFPAEDPNWLAFETQIYLEHLKITVQRTGHLGYIPTSIFYKLKLIIDVDISYGQINEINSFAFGNLTKLSKVILANNQIRYLLPYAFANHVDLVEIDLEQNQIVDIDKLAFVNVPNLSSVNLSKNNISRLHDDVFTELRKLLDLRLESNAITVLTREMFKGLGNLRTLRLSYNNLAVIGDTVFAELWGLQELDLDNNNIEKISERAFDGLNVLKRLRLEDNKISYLEPGVFTGVPALRYLDLSNNRLSSITFNNILPLWDNLVNISSTLDLTENRLICDCRLRWIFDLRRKTKNEDLRQSLQRIECFYEGAGIARAGHGHALNPIGNNGAGGAIGIPGMIPGISGAGNLLGPGDIYHDPNLFNQRPNGPNDNGEYIDETNFDNQLNGIGGTNIGVGGRIGKGNIAQLLQLNEEMLPCTQRLSDPTELPLQRESIGMVDLSWRTDQTGSSTAHNSKVSLVSCLTLILSCTVVIYSIVTVFH